MGDGKSTKILSDNWIPDIPPYTVRTLVSIEADQTVDTLINEDSQTWKSDLIKHVFLENIATKILQVQVSRHGGDEFASWPLSRFGTYTVRSAYKLARLEKFAVKHSHCSQDSSSTMDEDAK